MDAGKDRGIWAKSGLDPEFVTIQGRAILASDLKQQVASGIKIGISIPSEVLLARANGVPVKIVAGYIGEAPVKLFVKGDGSIKSLKDLDGKNVGIVSNEHSLIEYFRMSPANLESGPSLLRLGTFQVTLPL
jgi:ABC-type nitrate/sulfonate/bicarbonate transport system substrate-binding protein